MLENMEKEELWKEIEQVYITTEISLRELSRQYGLPYSRIRRRFIKDEWKRKREEMKKANFQIISDFVMTQMEDNVKRITSITLKVLDALEFIIDNIDTKDAEAVRIIKEITSAMKHLKDIGIFRMDLDKQEQIARIAKLRKELEGESVDREIKVVFESNLDDYAR